jgi:hypothetical protein
MSDTVMLTTDDEPDCDDPNDWSSETTHCEDCWGDSDPLDDLFYCSTCAGRGWIYVEMLNAPHLSHWDVEQELRKQRERDAAHRALSDNGARS